MYIARHLHLVYTDSLHRYYVLECSFRSHISRVTAATERYVLRGTYHAALQCDRHFVTFSFRADIPCGNIRMTFFAFVVHMELYQK